MARRQQVPAERRAGYLVPPEAAAAWRYVEDLLDRLARRGALDGADNPVRPFIAELERGWVAAHRREHPSPDRDEPVDAAPTAAGTPPRGRVEDATVDESPARPVPAEGQEPPPRRHTALRLLMVLAFAGDVANFYLALAVVANASPLVTVLVVVALACSALGLAYLAGRFLRARAEGLGGSLPVIVALAALVLLLGLGAAAIRLAAPAPELTGGGGAFGGGGEGLLSPVAVNVVLTVLLLVLFWASAAMAAVLGYDARDRTAPARTVPLRRRVERAVTERTVTRRRRAGQDRVAARSSEQESHQREESRRRHLAALLVLRSEIKIAEICGDPRTTTVLTRGGIGEVR